MKKRPSTDTAYAAFVSGIKARIQGARLSAARAVNRDLILLYWDIGQGIVEKQRTHGWGESVVEKLSRDLRKLFPGMSGFSAVNLWRMKQFYDVHTSGEFLGHFSQTIENEWISKRSPILSQLVRELGKGRSVTSRNEILSQAVRELATTVPWGHHTNHLAKIDDSATRLYYLAATARFGWSRNVLLNQIKAGAYERSRRETKSHNFPAALPEHLAEQAEEALKSGYNLEFLGIRKALKERDLEDRLLDHLRDFILELGYGFCFVGRQHRIKLGKKEYAVDLLFYHRFLKALVAIELKLGAFEPEHSGKMDFYLNVLNETERGPGDAPSIGIILCAEKDGLEVEFALKSKVNPIGVAEYSLRPKLPSEFKGKLPTSKQLTDALREELDRS